MNVKPYDMQHDVIIACDFKSAEDTFKFLDLFRGEARKPFLKIGMDLFYAEGPEIVREITGYSSTSSCTIFPIR